MAYDCFLKLDGIEGESLDKTHSKEINIYSFSWGASNPQSVGYGEGSGGGKVSISSFNVMKKTDKASSILFNMCCAGNHIAFAEVTLRKAGGEPLEYLKYKFDQCFVDSIQWSGSAGGDDSPTESVSFSFAKCHVDYQPQDAKGKAAGKVVSGGWDLQQNILA